MTDEEMQLKLETLEDSPDQLDLFGLALISEEGCGQLLIFG
jgi:hypothetical protein